MIFPERQLQRKFKHATDFGVVGDFNATNSAKFRQALQVHVLDNATLTINGTYRGEQVTHFLNPHTGLNIIANQNNTFISGWKLNAEQLQNVLDRSSL